MPAIKAFNDIKRKSLPTPSGIGGLDDLRRVAALEVGTGARAVKMDQSGLWIGGNKFEDANFKINLLGALFAQSANGQIQIDTPNNRIVIYEGATPRVLIGYHSGGF